jgi:hypothetical protein
MSRILRFIAEFANFFHAMFGSGVQRPFSRQALEDRIGPFWTKAVMSIPVITVVGWFAIWGAAKIFGLPAGEDPFAWMRNTFGN